MGCQARHRISTAPASARSFIGWLPRAVRSETLIRLMLNLRRERHGQIVKASEVQADAEGQADGQGWRRPSRLLSEFPGLQIAPLGLVLGGVWL